MLEVSHSDPFELGDVEEPERDRTKRAELTSVRVEDAEVGSPRIVVIHQPETTVSFGELADTATAHGFQSGIGWNHDFAAGAVGGKAGDQTGLGVVDPEVTQASTFDFTRAGRNDLAFLRDLDEFALVIADPEACR